MISLAASGALAEPLGPGTVRQALTRQRERIQSLDVEYVDDIDISAEARTLLQFEFTVTHSEVRFAFKGAKRYRRMVHPENGKTGLVEATFNGEVCQIVDHSNKVATVQIPKSRFVELNTYTYNQFLPITDDDSRDPTGGQYWLPQALDSPGWQVAERTEVIDGATCVRFERGGEDILWIDPQLGYTVRKRRRRLLSDQPAVTHDYQFLQLAQVVAGTWLPREIIHTVTREPDEKHVRPIRLFTQRIRASRLSVNTVGDNLFDSVAVPPGMLIADTINRLNYMKPVGGPGQLESAVADAQRMATRTHQITELLLWFNGAMALGIVVGLLWPKRKVESSRPS